MKNVAYSVLLLALVGFTSCQKKQTGPIMTRYSDIYQVDDQWFCPLCNQPVKNGDRSHIDPALYLSEWHDVYLDPQYFETKINHISDQELLNSLAFNPRLENEINRQKQQKRKDEIFQEIKKYFADRPDNGRLYHYDQAEKIPFITINEFLEKIKSDKKRKETILEAGQNIADPDSGYKIANVNFGNKIDFNFDWQHRSDFGVHYCRFFVDLLNAYTVTQSNFYRDSFEDIFNQWYDQKDDVKHKMKSGESKHRDVIWYELGLGSRIPRMIDSYRVHKSKLSPETHKRMLKTVLGSARWLYQCLTRTPFHPYNWQTQTAMTLAYIAFTFPEFTEAPQCLEASRKNMELHIKNDILDDGGYIERTGSYTSYVFGMVYRYMLMFKYFAEDDSLLEAYLPRLEKLSEFTALTMTPLGVNCPFNDCIRGTGLADLLIEMGEFFNRGDFLGAVQSRIPAETLVKLKTRPTVPEVTSVNFVDSKFAVMRDGWQPESYFMMINYGPFQNHGHYDILDFEIFANGVPIAVDAGIGLWGYSDPIHVSWYKQSFAHNMLVVDESIVNKRNIEGENVIWAPQNMTDYFAATHHGYKEFHNTSCRRHFAFVKGQYWLIVDEVFTPHKNKNLDWYFHTPLHMKETPFGFVSKQFPGAAVIFPANDVENITKIKRSGHADLRGINEEEPNREIDWVILRKSSKAIHALDVFSVLIYPITEDKPHLANFDAPSPALSFEQITLDQTAAYGFKIIADGFEDVLIFSDGQQHSFSDDLQGDFIFGWFRKKDSKPVQFSAANVSNLNWRDAANINFAQKTNMEQRF